MNEEVLLKLYEKYNLSSVGSYDQFKQAVQTPEGAQKIHAKYLSGVGSYEQFQEAIGAATQPAPVVEAPKAEPNKIWEFVKSVPGLFSRGATEFIPSVMEVAAAGESLIGSGLRKLGINESEESLFAKGAGATREFIEEGTYVSPEAEQSIAGQVVKGVGQIVPFVATMGASGGAQALSQAPKVLSAAQLVPETAKAIGKQMVSPSGVIGGSMIAGPEWAAAKEAGLSDEDAFNTMIKNYFVGQTEVIPIQNAMKVFNAISGGKVMNALKSMGTGGIQGAVQEGFQTYLTNMIAQEDYDPERDPMFQVIESMKVGGLVGMFIPAVGSVVQSAKGETKVKLQNKLNELQADAEISAEDTGSPEINNNVDQQTQEVVDVIEGKDQVTSDITNKVDEVVQDTVQDSVQESESEQVLAEPDYQYTAFDAFDQKMELIDDEGYKGKIVDTGSGKWEFQGSKTKNGKRITKNIELGNVDAKTDESNYFDPATQISERGLTLAQPKSKPFDGATDKAGTIQSNIEKQWAVVANALAKGVRKGQTLVNEQIKKAQEVSKEAGMSPRQISAIMTKIRNYKPFSGDSGAKLSAFINKVANDAVYANKVSQSERRKQKIKEASRSKKTGLDDRRIAQEFTKLDPTEVANIDEYLEKANQLVRSYLPATRSKQGVVTRESKAAPIEDVREYIRKEIADQYTREMKSEPSSTMSIDDMSNTINDEMTRRKERDRLSKLAEESGLSFDDVVRLYEEDAYDNEDIKQQKLREQLTKLAEESRTSLPSTPPQPASTLSEASVKRDFNSLKAVDLNQLSNKQLNAYIKAVDKVVTNGDYGGLGAFTAEVEAQKGLTELESTPEITNTLFAPGAATKSLASLPQLMQSVFRGITSLASKFQLATGMVDVSDSGAKGQADRAALQSLLNEQQKKTPKAFEGDSRYRSGVYIRLLEYAEGSDPVTQLSENKLLIERDIASHKKAGDTSTAKVLENLLSPFRKAKTMDEVTSIMTKIDPDAKAVADILINFYQPRGKRVQEYLYRFFNKSEPIINNYGGVRLWVPTDKKNILTDSSFDPDRIEEAMKTDFYGSLGNPTQTSSSFGRKSKVSLDADGNPKPIDEVMNYDVTTIALDHVQQNTFEIEAIEHMIKIRAMVKNPRMMDILGAKKDPNKANELKRAIFDPKNGTYVAFEKSSLGIGDGPKDPLSKGISTGLKVAREIGYAATLSGPSQIIKQSTVLFNTAIRLGKDFSLLFSTDPLTQDGKEFLKTTTAGQRESSQAFLGFGEAVKLESFSDRAVHFQNELWISKMFKKAVAANMTFLTRTDAVVAQASYMAFYKQYIKNNGGKFSSWADEKTRSGEQLRREANAYAKQRVDVLQTASNPNEQSAAIKTRSLGLQIFKNAVIPYGTFSLNQKIRIANSGKQLLIGNNKQRAAALADIVGTTTEMVMFQAASWGLRIGLGMLVKLAFESVHGDLPDDDEEDKAIDFNNNMQRFVAQVATDMVPLIVTTPEIVREALPSMFNEAARMYYNAAYGEENGGYDLDMKEFKETIGVPFPDVRHSTKGIAKAAAETLGVYGRALAIGNDIFENYSDIVTEGEEDKEAEPMTDSQMSLVAWTGALQTMSFSGGVPSDVRFTLERLNRKQRRKRGLERSSNEVLFWDELFNQ